MKKILFLLFIFNQINAQKVRPFFETTYNIHSEFKNSSYYNIGIGSEVKLNKYIRPELEISYTIGAFGDFVDYDNQGNPLTIFNKKVTSINYSLSPKIIINVDEDANYYLQLLPKYSISRIQAIGDYLEINQSDYSKSISKKETITETKNSFGIGFGIGFNLAGKQTDSIIINIYYQNIDFASVLNKLANNNNSKLNTKNVLSFGLVYYFNFGIEKSN